MMTPKCKWLFSVLFGSFLIVAQSSPTRVDLFVAGAKAPVTYPCYRQPALIATNSERTHLLAFAEGRNVSSCAPPLSSVAVPPPSNEVGGLVVRKSLDMGSSWSDPVTMYSGDIDFYVAVLDVDTDVIWLTLQEGNAVKVFQSRDEGTTWSAAVDLSVKPPPGFGSPVKPAVGHGIQINGDLCSGGCSNKGRLVLPFVCTSSTLSADKGLCPSCHACMLLSDDHGKTWNFGGVGQSGSRESQAVQIKSDSTDTNLWVTERNFGAVPGHRMFASSADGGATLTGFGIDNSTISPITPHWTGIVASISRLSDPSTAFAEGRIVLSIPNNATARANLSIKASDDSGKTWGEPKTLYHGLSGYSDMARLSMDAIGIIYENGDDTFADRISYTYLNNSWFQ